MTDSQSGGEVVKSGYLIKSPPLSRAPVSQWHKRWFKLLDSKRVYPMAKRFIRLDYYQSEADAKSLADPKGTINLDACVGVLPHIDPIKNYKHVFDVCTEERVYHLSAESQEDKWSWVNTLQELLFPPKTKTGPASQDSRPNTEAATDVVRRLRDGGSKPVRPHSFNPSSTGGKISSRPLPPVPGTPTGNPSGSPVTVRNRPLPSPPSSLSSSTPTIHIQPVGSQNSPGSSRKASRGPPQRPTPYRKNASEPFPPVPSPPEHSPLPRSGSFSPPRLFPEEYQEFVSSSSQNVDDIPTNDYEEPASHFTAGNLDVPIDSEENNYSLASSVPRRQLPRTGPRVSPAGPRPPPSNPHLNSRQPPTNSRPSPSSSHPPQSNSRPPQSNSRPPQSNFRPPQSNSRPPQSNSRPPQSNSRTPQSNSRSPQSNSRSPQSNSHPSPSSSRSAPSNSRPSPARSRPSPSNRPPSSNSDSQSSGPPSRSQKPTKPPKPSLLAKPKSIIPSTLNKVGAKLAQASKRPTPVARTYRPMNKIVGAGTNTTAGVNKGGNQDQDYSVLEESGQDYSVLEDSGQDYSVLEDDGQQDYSVVEDDDHEYGVVEDTQQDYSVLENVDHDYGIVDDSQQDYSLLEDTGIDNRNIEEIEQDYGNVDNSTDQRNIEDEVEYGNLDDVQADYSNIDTAEDYGNIDTAEDYGNIDTAEDYGNIDTDQDYGNVDTAQDYGSLKAVEQRADYSVLHASSTPGYNPQDKNYSHLGSTSGADESPPPPLRHASLAPHHSSVHTSSSKPQDHPLSGSRAGYSHSPPTAKGQRLPKPRKKLKPLDKGPDYVNCPSGDDDYSRLNH